MGPAILITIGVLFLLQQAHWAYRFGRTWPVILLVIGGLKLAEALASDAGHGAQQVPPQVPPGQGPGQIPPPPPPPLS
jgi:hypothetical protein